MSPILETVGIVLAVAGGTLAGWWFAHGGKRYYWAAVGVALALVLYVSAAWWLGRSDVLPVPGIGLYFAGRSKLVVMGLAAPLLQVALHSRLKKKTERKLVAVFLSIVMVRVIIFPFAFAAIAAADLANLKTQIDTKGVCLQSRDYTCGPAAAVTVLRRTGVPAEEGDLAVLARSNSLGGTDLEMLAQAINTRYGGYGVACQCRHFKGLDELREAGCSLGVIEYNPWMDHCVAVLGVDGERVNTGDPLIGLHPYHRSDFEKSWRHIGIIFQRKI
jgi:hypothetical protein